MLPCMPLLLIAPADAQAHDTPLCARAALSKAGDVAKDVPKAVTLDYAAQIGSEESLAA